MAVLRMTKGKLPCAFCGADGRDVNTAIVLQKDDDAPEHRRYFYSCNNCGATGPVDGDAFGARAKWNQRPNIISVEVPDYGE